MYPPLGSHHARCVVSSVASGRSRGIGACDEFVLAANYYRGFSRGASARRAIHFVPTLWLVIASLVACASRPAAPADETARHLSAPATPRVASPVIALPPAPALPATERYTVVAKDVSTRDLLFSLARDANLNLDIAPEVTGRVTINAVDQPLPQILERIARQANLRFHLAPPTLTIAADRPYIHTYTIDYVNMARKATSSVSVATEIATTGIGATAVARGAGTNNSTTILEQESSNQFWETLIANVKGLLGGGESALLVNRESGLLTVRATQRQHEEIQRLLDHVLTRAQQQVLIEATVVEVELSDRFQAGVDWSMVDDDSGISFQQQLLGTTLAAPPVATLTIDRPGNNNLLATIKLLQRFGDLKVLSSPKVMALNNQTAMLKVVDNRVYFTITVDIQAGTASSPAITTYQSNVHTVPVGFVMAVTPQISDTDLITLNVRPTISRVLAYVNDPNPALAQANVVSQIPEIQVREIESVLKVSSGQIAVLGGLMQDTVDRNRAGVPLLSHAPVIGGLFSYRDDQARKTELVIFLRPTVIRSASLDGDLRGYRAYLANDGLGQRPE